MDAAISNGVQSLSYSWNASNITNVETLEEKLFGRVVSLLADKGVGVKGSGAISLDLREDGSIEVIGDIKNKGEIEEALAGDDEVISILQQGKDLDVENKSSSDTVVISDEAINKYMSSYSEASKKNNVESTDGLDNASYIESTEKTPVTETDKRKVLLDLLGYGENVNSQNLLECIDSACSSISDKMQNQKAEIATLIGEIAKQAGLAEEDIEGLEFSLGEGDEIVVSAKDETDIDAVRAAKKLGEAINSSSSITKDVAGKLHELGVTQRTLSKMVKFREPLQLDDGRVNKEPVIENELLKELAELKYGGGVDNILELDEVKENSTLYRVLENVAKDEISTGNEVIDEFVRTDMTATDNASTGNKFTYSNGTVENEDTQRITDEVKKHYEHEIKYVMNGLIDDAASNDIKTAITSFELLFDKDGSMKVTNAEDTIGSNFGNSLTGQVNEILSRTENSNDRLGTIVSQLFQTHQAEHGDSEEYEHFIRITVDVSSGLELDVISPEADKQATKELKNNLEGINEEVNHVLADEHKIDAPVEIKVDKDGKLEANTDSLQKADAKVVKSIIDEMNKVLEVNETKDKDEQDVEGNSQEDDIDDTKVKDYAGGDTEESSAATKVIEKFEGEIAESNGEETETELVEVSTSKTGARSGILKGLEYALSLAGGLKEILGKFHEEDNLLAALK